MLVSVGAVEGVLATDPAAEKEFVAFCKATGHRLMQSGSRDGLYRGSGPARLVAAKKPTPTLTARRMK
jgi:hypothetical protein